MKMIFKKFIPRRTFLRGVGTAIALPLLDGMVPAFGAKNDAAKAVARMAFFYGPNGRNHGPVDAGDRGCRFQDVSNSGASDSISGSTSGAERTGHQGR